MSADRELKALAPETVSTALEALGLRRGDSVVVHSDLGRFGIVRNSNRRFELALGPDVLYRALRGTLGPEGTIAAPAFSYSWSRGLTYSLANSRVVAGSFGDYLRQLPGARRSRHPMMSVTADGPGSEELLDRTDNTSYGEGSPFGNMLRTNMQHVTLGVSVCCFSDYVQWACRVPYRYRKRFRGWIESDGACQEVECEHCVRFWHQEMDPYPLFDVFDTDTTSTIRRAELQGVGLRAVCSTDLFEMISERLAADPYAFSTKPSDERAITFLGNWIAGQPDIEMEAVDRDGIERWVWTFPEDRVDFFNLGGEIRRDESETETTPGLVREALIMPRTERTGAALAIDIASRWLELHDDGEDGFGLFLLDRLARSDPITVLMRRFPDEVRRPSAFRPDLCGPLSGSKTN